MTTLRTAPHFVYIIKEPLQNRKFTCKIGFSKNVNQRLKTLQGGNPRQLTVFETFLIADNSRDAKRIENHIQKMLGDFNVSFNGQRETEWFTCNPVDLTKYIIPEIEHFIDGLNVKVNIPTKAIAESKWTYQMYKEIKEVQFRLLGRKDKGTLTTEDEYKLEVMTRELKKQENLEREEGKKVRKMREAKAKAYKAKKLLEIGIFM